MTSVPAKSEQAEHAVVELKPCKFVDHGWHGFAACNAARDCNRKCDGCMRDGTRVDLSSGVKVRKSTALFKRPDDIGFIHSERLSCWVAVPSTEETNG